SGELNEHGQVIVSSAMCDSGVMTGSATDPEDARGFLPGGPILPCEEVGPRNIMIGPAQSTYTFSASPTVSLLRNMVNLFAMVEGKFGGWNEESNMAWAGHFAGTAKYWANNDPVW